MSVLITGAAGFIGSSLVDRLLERGQTVVGLDNYDDFYDPAIKERNLSRARDHSAFSEARGDIRDGAVLKTLPDDIDTVVHIAARAGVRASIENPTLCFDVNLTGTVNLLEWIRERSIDRLAFASSSSVYGDLQVVPFNEEDRVDSPISPYAASKKAAELICHTHGHLYGTSIVCLRLFTVYGPRQRPDLAIHKFARLMKAGEEIPMYGDGSSSRDYTYIDDLLEGLEGALDWLEEHDGACEIVNLGESRAIELSEMIRVLGEEMGVTPRVRSLPAQPGDVARTYADITKARRLFGYEPGTDFRTGVRYFLDWLEDVG